MRSFELHPTARWVQPETAPISGGRRIHFGSVLRLEVTRGTGNRQEGQNSISRACWLSFL